VLRFTRWQWLWRSRRRLFAFGLVVFLLGVGLLAWLVYTAVWGRPNTNIGRGIPAPVILMAVGGYAMLQAVFSGGEAFGDHDYDDSREWRRRAWRRRQPAPPDDRPIPRAPDTGERPAVDTTRCPTCREPVSATAAECPKCHERFTPD
jgi:hypothetical protein